MCELQKQRKEKIKICKETKKKAKNRNKRRFDLMTALNKI
jgi:hypothetical protein